MVFVSWWYISNIMKKIKEKMPTIDIKKYGGKQVAILNGEVVASGKTWKEVLEKAHKKAPGCPMNEFVVFAVPRTLNVIYYA